MKVPYKSILKQAFGVLLNEIPIVGHAHQIYQGVKQDQDYEKLVLRLEKLEMGQSSQYKLGKVENRKLIMQHWSGNLYSEPGNPYQSINRILDPEIHADNNDDFYFVLFIKPIAGKIITGNNAMGVSLPLLDPTNGKQTLEYFQLYSSRTEAALEYNCENFQELGREYIPRTKVYRYTISRIDGILSCDVNGIRIYGHRPLPRYYLTFGLYLDKGNKIEYDANLIIKK